MQYLVSIIIPTYNRSHCVSNAIDSVLAQSYGEWEIVIVDDGSSDDTLAVIDNYSDPRIRCIRHPTNRGVIAAKSTGLDNVRGQWIGILDSDDTLYSDAIAQCMHVVETWNIEDGALGTVIGNCISSQDTSYTGKGLTASGIVSYADFLCGRVHGEFWGVFSRDILGELRFDPQIIGFESTLWLKLYRKSVTYYIHQGLRNYTVAESTDQLSSIDNMLARADKLAYGYGLLIAEHDFEMKSNCPERNSYLLRRKAFFERIAGHRWQGVKDSWRVLSSSKSFEDVGFFLAMLFVPSNILARLARSSIRLGLR